MSTFQHEDGRVLSAYEGSVLEKTLQLDDEWAPIADEAIGDDPREWSQEAALDAAAGDLSGEKRGVLDQIAGALGVADPEKLPNKPAVLDEIAKARAAALEGRGGGTLGDVPQD